MPKGPPAGGPRSGGPLLPLRRNAAPGRGEPGGTPPGRWRGRGDERSEGTRGRPRHGGEGERPRRRPPRPPAEDERSEDDAPGEGGRAAP